jgi:hypothetical protein
MSKRTVSAETALEALHTAIKEEGEYVPNHPGIMAVTFRQWRKYIHKIDLANTGSEKAKRAILRHCITHLIKTGAIETRGDYVWVKQGQKKVRRARSGASAPSS